MYVTYTKLSFCTDNKKHSCFQKRFLSFVQIVDYNSLFLRSFTQSHSKLLRKRIPDLGYSAGEPKTFYSNIENKPIDIFDCQIIQTNLQVFHMKQTVQTLIYSQYLECTNCLYLMFVLTTVYIMISELCI